VVGINAAVSSRATSIGFAVPINQAIAILPQLRESGRVTRGYIGVKLRTVDADLQRSLRLSSAAARSCRTWRPARRASAPACAPTTSSRGGRRQRGRRRRLISTWRACGPARRPR
jgi:hypothetical protein